MSHVLEAQLPDERDLLVDQLLSQVADVQVDVVPVRALERAPLLLLLDEGTARAGPAGPSSMERSTGLGVGLAQVVVLEIAVAVLVEEPAALRARRFGDQDPGEREARSGWYWTNSMSLSGAPAR